LCSFHTSDVRPLLAGLVGGEGEAAHCDGPGDVRGSGHLAAGEAVGWVADVADLAPAGSDHRHFEQAGAGELTGLLPQDSDRFGRPPGSDAFGWTASGHLRWRLCRLRSAIAAAARRDASVPLALLARLKAASAPAVSPCRASSTPR